MTRTFTEYFDGQTNICVKSIKEELFFVGFDFITLSSKRVRRNKEWFNQVKVVANSRSLKAYLFGVPYFYNGLKRN